jgi:hypothetical protein
MKKTFFIVCKEHGILLVPSLKPKRPAKIKDLSAVCRDACTNWEMNSVPSWETNSVS